MISQIERLDQKVLRVEIDAESKPGWEFWMPVTSDRHHDNTLSRHDIIKYHQDLSQERNGRGLDVGDFFCLMQGKGDPRSDIRQRRKSFDSQAYVNQIVKEAADYYAPYAHNFTTVSPGNHEWQYLDRHGVDVLELFTDRIHNLTGHRIHVNPMQGWYKLRFHYQSTHKQSFNIAYHHGYGGGGPVTKDMIQANRILAYTENADIVLFGHTHDSWYSKVVRNRVDDQAGGKGQLRRLCHVIKIGSYKEEDQNDGWSVLKGHPPKPTGGWWLRFYWFRERVRLQVIAMEEYE